MAQQPPTRWKRSAYTIRSCSDDSTRAVRTEESLKYQRERESFAGFWSRDCPTLARKSGIYWDVRSNRTYIARNMRLAEWDDVKWDHISWRGKFIRKQFACWNNWSKCGTAPKSVLRHWMPSRVGPTLPSNTCEKRNKQRKKRILENLRATGATRWSCNVSARDIAWSPALWHSNACDQVVGS